MVSRYAANYVVSVTGEGDENNTSHNGPAGKYVTHGVSRLSSRVLHSPREGQRSLTTWLSLGAMPPPLDDIALQPISPHLNGIRKEDQSSAAPSDPMQLLLSSASSANTVYNSAPLGNSASAIRVLDV